MSLDAALTTAQAHAALEDQDVVACAEAALPDAKELVGLFLNAGIPAALGRDECCGGGCSPKALVLVRPEDVARVSDVMRERWQSMVAREESHDDPSVFRFHAAAAMHGEGAVDAVTCPACGHEGELKENGCADCGLILA